MPSGTTPHDWHVVFVPCLFGLGIITGWLVVEVLPWELGVAVVAVKFAVVTWWSVRQQRALWEIRAELTHARLLLQRLAEEG